jgi:ElaB/YqjD/DUF883 family membrane-anchored ribosome-binding protein
MNNYKMVLILLISMNYSEIKTHNKSIFNEKIKEIANKLHSSVYKTANWFEYYKKAFAYNLADWIKYCSTVAKNDTEAFASFIIDEKDATFASLNKSEQKAVRDINRFYKKMASASKEKQEDLIRNFSKKWKKYQHMFNNANDKAGHEAENFKNEIKEITDKLNHSVGSTADWAEYYAHACIHDLAKWVEYYRTMAQDDPRIFENFIIDENNAVFHNLSPDAQEVIQDLNDFYKEMAHANREEQDELVEDYSTEWKECQRIFHKNS